MRLSYTTSASWGQENIILLFDRALTAFISRYPELFSWIKIEIEQPKMSNKSRFIIIEQNKVAFNKMVAIKLAKYVVGIKVP